MLTQKRLQELLNYDAETGAFHRLSGKFLGQIAGWMESSGYCKLIVDGKKEYAHRVAWLYMTGAFPKNKIDHRDTDRANNRFSNLREASDAINSQNITKAQKNNKLGLLGVYRKRKKFVARIYANGIQHIIGSFDIAEQAHAAYVQAKRELHEGCTI